MEYEDVVSKLKNDTLSYKENPKNSVSDMQLSLSMDSLPVEDRPRERLLSKGSSSLSSVELLSILLSKGTKGDSVLSIAHRVISKFGDLHDISKISVEELLSIKGIGIAKACQIVAGFELSRRISGNKLIRSKTYDTAEDIYGLVKPYLTSRQKEHLIIITLDSRRRLIAIDNISIGTINQSLAHPREVFKAAINRRASFVVLAHNHPSGDCEPSADDIAMTERMISVSYTMGIPILDHIIVADTDYLSLRDAEFIK